MTTKHHSICVHQEAMHALPLEGYVRIKKIISPTGPIPVCKSTWWAGVRSGRFPKPVKNLGPGITAWKVEDIRKLFDETVTTIDESTFN